MTGRTFNGRYEIKERIGVGGMAEVYSAQDNVLGRMVAVKVMLPQYAADPDFTQRFRQEAAAAANLQSPYIVNVYDWGHDGGIYFIVMEFVRGSDLKTAIKQRGAINQRKVAEIGAQVCQALTVAHKQDIIHRDIKPQNIMVQPDGNVKVMDFGIARAKNSMKQQTASVLGTAHYISPEQAQGKELTAASDIYSLGIAMYEATTGELPFDGEDAVSVAMQQVTDLPPLPSDINPRIDPALEDIIMCALSKNPRERFATANDMRLALNDYLAGRPVNLSGASGAGMGGMGGMGGGFGAAETRMMGAVGGAAAATAVIGAAGAASMGAKGAKGAGMGPGAGNATQVMPPMAGGMRAAGASGAAGNAGTTRKTGTNFSIEEPKKSKVPFIVAGVVAALAIIAAAVFFLMGGMGGGKEVPNVIGMPQEQAVETIEAAGFQVGSIDTKYDESAAEGEVIGQDPEGGLQKPEGTKINLTVSSGVEEITLPDFTNMTIEEAQKEAAKYDLVLQASPAQYSADVELNRIISTDPVAKTKVPKGSTVKYVLSLGVENIDVPNTAGKSRNTAMELLQNAGFKVSIDEEYSSTVGAGIVISQTPNGGKLETGQTVTIVVSLGAEPQPEPEPEPEPSGGSTNSGGSGSGSGGSEEEGTATGE